MSIPLNNLSSLLQLACGLCFVFGGYQAVRRQKEDEIELQLTRSSELIGRLRQKNPVELKGFACPRETEEPTNLSVLPANKLTFSDVAQLRKDVTNRFYSRWHRYRRLEMIEFWALWTGAIFSFCSLFLVSVVPQDITVNEIVAIVWIVLSFASPAAVMFGNYDRYRALDRASKRTNNPGKLDDHVELDGDGKSKRPGRSHEQRSSYRDGEIDFITNHIRRLSRSNGIQD